MAISLFHVTVPGYLQTTGAIAGVLERGLTFCKDKGLDPAELVETRLYPDMLPLSFQIASVAHHSLGAINAVKKGVFLPPAGPFPAQATPERCRRSSPTPARRSAP